MKLAIRVAILVPLLAGGAGLAAAVDAAAQATAVQQDQKPQLSVARFWRGNGTTLLEGVVGTPVDPADTTGPQLELVIRDHSGQILHQESWTDTVSPAVRRLASERGDVEVSTPVTVRLTSGRYTFGVKVSHGRTLDTASATVTAFAEAPLISDVIVSSAMRTLAEGEQATRAEARLGNVAVVRSAWPKVLPDDGALWYYVELYAPAGVEEGSTAELEFAAVPAAGGHALFRTTRRLQLNKQGGSDAARLRVAGLPPGEYVLQVTARVGNRTEERQARFAMAGFDATPVSEITVGAASSTEERLYEKYFAPSVLAGSRVDEIADALTVVSLGEQAPSYITTMDNDAKRRFLARYFTKTADPVPATPEHELLEEYTKRATYVAREFAEPDLKRTGLRTERGRIYLKYGAPDAKQVFPLSSAGRGSVEVWRYSRQRGVKYAFLDETGFGHYTLVYTTDPNAQSVPDWEERVKDREVIRLIRSF